MDCSQVAWLTDKDFFEQFSRKALHERIPLSGSIDLTYRCNFRCVHCYIGSRKDSAPDFSGELETEQWLGLLDQIAEAGCLFLLITGGDPLLRPDFCEIYRHAKARGMILTVFTNGTTLTEEIIATFQKFPPRSVEITLYGMSDETCREITGREKVPAACFKAVELLKKSNVAVSVKTILMRKNIHEFQQMKQFAEKHGLKFRHDAGIFPGFFDSVSVDRLRISAEKAAEIDFADSDRAEEWGRYYNRISTSGLGNHLFLCGSGLTTFHINPYGMLQPCLMETMLQYDLKTGDFSHGWHAVMPEIRKKTRSASSPCIGCDKLALCGICPPFARLETGSEEGRSEFLCTLGHSRYTYINKL